MKFCCLNESGLLALSLYLTNIYFYLCVLMLNIKFFVDSLNILIYLYIYTTTMFLVSGYSMYDKKYQNKKSFLE